MSVVILKKNNKQDRLIHGTKEYSTKNDMYTVKFQTDGNLVVYRNSNNSILWSKGATGTYRYCIKNCSRATGKQWLNYIAGHILELNSSGNLVCYSKANEDANRTHTYWTINGNTNVSKLILRPNGQLALTSNDELTDYWTSTADPLTTIPTMTGYTSNDKKYASNIGNGYVTSQIIKHSYYPQCQTDCNKNNNCVGINVKKSDQSCEVLIGSGGTKTTNNDYIFYDRTSKPKTLGGYKINKTGYTYKDNSVYNNINNFLENSTSDTNLGIKTIDDCINACTSDNKCAAVKYDKSTFNCVKQNNLIGTTTTTNNNVISYKKNNYTSPAFTTYTGYSSPQLKKQNGQIIQSFSNINTSNFKTQCIDNCKNNKYCSGVSYNHNIDNVTAGTCNLYNTNGTLTADSNTLTYRKSPYTAPTVATLTASQVPLDYYNNIYCNPNTDDYYVINNGSFDNTVSNMITVGLGNKVDSENTCKTYCNNINSCKTYQYNTSTKNCKLYADLPTKQATTSSILHSGIKKKDLTFDVNSLSETTKNIVKKKCVNKYIYDNYVNKDATLKDKININDFATCITDPITTVENGVTKINIDSKCVFDKLSPYQKVVIKDTNQYADGSVNSDTQKDPVIDNSQNNYNDLKGSNIVYDNTEGKLRNYDTSFTTYNQTTEQDFDQLSNMYVGTIQDLAQKDQAQNDLNALKIGYTSNRGNLDNLNEGFSNMTEDLYNSNKEKYQKLFIGLTVVLILVIIYYYFIYKKCILRRK